jgi:hypothetical protein
VEVLECRAYCWREGMCVMDIAEVVLRLAGPVEPVGDSAMDAHRLENLRTLCDVAGVLLDRIELVADAYGDHMASVKAAKDHAAAFLRTRGVMVVGTAATRPPCTVCGAAYEKHGSYPTCASHPYSPDGRCGHVGIFADGRFTGAPCAGAECRNGCARAAGVTEGPK